MMAETQSWQRNARRLAPLDREIANAALACLNTVPHACSNAGVGTGTLRCTSRHDLPYRKPEASASRGHGEVYLQKNDRFCLGKALFIGQWCLIIKLSRENLAINIIGPESMPGFLQPFISLMI